MNESKAYILRHTAPLSIEYSEMCSSTCDKVGLEWEYFEGYTNMTRKEAWSKTGLKLKFKNKNNELDQYWISSFPHIENKVREQRHGCVDAGHASIWRKIADSDKIGIILEHDALMCYNPSNITEFKIPDYFIIMLGYKTDKPENYDYIEANKQVPRLHYLERHQGAHGYMMTPKTARYLLDEIEEFGVLGDIDNSYFIRGPRSTKIPLLIMSPTPVLGWVRKSTINADPNKISTFNYDFIPEFDKYFKK